MTARALRYAVAFLCGALPLLASVAPADAQLDDSGGICVPAAERAGRAFGCYIVASATIGQLDAGPVFWHLWTFSTRAEAEAAAPGIRSSIVEALGRVWLMTIAPQNLHISGETQVAAIGPLPITADVAYTAQYMEAVFRPGMKSIVHRHSGPEAWYTLTGETCLETPAGIVVGGAGGDHVIVPQGPPMELTATGTEVRRALVLILHDSTQPASSPATDWIPAALCRG